MSISEQCIQEAREFAIKSLSEYYSGFTLRHTFNMFDLFGRVKNFDKGLREDIIVFSILLHDVGRRIREKDHSLISFEVIEKEFKDKINREDMELIKDCVVNHSSGMNPMSEEAKIVQDIDKLSMIQPNIILEYIFHVSKESDLITFKENIIRTIHKCSSNFNNKHIAEFYQREDSEFILRILNAIEMIGEQDYG